MTALDGFARSTVRGLRLVPTYLAASMIALLGLALLWLMPGHVGYFSCCIEVHPSGLPAALLLLLLAAGLFARRRTAQLGAIALCLMLIIMTVGGNVTTANVMWGVLVQSIFTVALLTPPRGHWRPARFGIPEWSGLSLAAAWAASAVLVPGYHW